MKNLIVKPNKKKNPNGKPYKLRILTPLVVTMGINTGVAMMLKARVEEEEVVARRSILATLLKEIRGGGGQRNE